MATGVDMFSTPQCTGVLKQRIAILEKELNETRQAMDKMRKRINEGVRRETDSITKQFKEAYAKQDDDYRAAYRAVTIRLQKAHTQEITKLRQEYSKLSAKQESVIKELNLAHDELAEELAKIKRENSYHQRIEQQNAEAAAKQLVRNIRDARKLPVESFYPHKLEIYENSALRCGELLRQKLFLASFSVAEGASLGVENVKADTKRKMKELSTYFERYVAMYQSITELIASDCMHRMNDESGNLLYEMDDMSLDYWSDGCYRDFMNIVEEHGTMIAQIRRNGLSEWVKNGGNIEILRNRIEELNSLPELLNVAVGYAFSALDCYQAMFDIRNKATELLRSQGFSYSNTMFGSAQEKASKTNGFIFYRDRYLIHEICNQPDETADYREERVISYTRDIGSSLKPEAFVIRLIPVRTGDTVACRACSELDAEHAQQPLHETLDCLLLSHGVPLGSDFQQSMGERIFDIEQARQIANERAYNNMGLNL